MGVWIETICRINEVLNTSVTPCVGVWIETSNAACINVPYAVTPCVGVWIETFMVFTLLDKPYVTPCVGVWIETLLFSQKCWIRSVTPCVGVWIETPRIHAKALQPESHPAWVCGLKQLWERNTLKNNCHTLRGCVDWNDEILEANRDVLVTPCVGVWIETCQTRL